ncbi:MAG: DUF4258 domain-containing protein [Candidatus Promineifilaceae bacterium]|nr:DUF4258 domain-containing protein [Candidatus Promineifilaceae bacterium]
MTNKKSRKKRKVGVYILTHHAVQRMCQREITKMDINTAINEGTKLYRSGIVFFFIDENNLSDFMREIMDYLIGVTVLCDPVTKEIITVYRNPDALNDIKLKPEYAIP